MLGWVLAAMLVATALPFVPRLVLAVLAVAALVAAQLDHDQQHLHRATPGEQRFTRTGLRCPTCHTDSRVETDLLIQGRLVVSLQGCQACQSGLFAPTEGRALPDARTPE